MWWFMKDSTSGATNPCEVDIQGASTDGHIMGTWLTLAPDHSDIMAVYRTNLGSQPTYRRSTDGGSTWGPWGQISATGTDAGAPTNGVSSLSLDWDDPSSPLHGWHVISGSEHGNARWSMVVAITQNPTGVSWDSVLQLNHLGPEPNRQGPIPPEVAGDGENADPTLFQGRDGNIHLLFTGRGGQILKHYVLDPYALTGTSAPEPPAVPTMGLLGMAGLIVGMVLLTHLAWASSQLLQGR